LALPAGATTTGGRWVFDFKRDSNGTVTRYKARYVAQGYTQRAGVDYMDVWAPCPARATVCAVMAMVAADDLELHVIDIKMAYLTAPMDMDVYVQQPEGYDVGAPGTVARLLHALYGCKQAGRLWGNHCHKTLTDFGAERSTADPKMYLWRHAVHGPIFILVHVDDMAVAAKTLSGVSAAKDVVLSTYKGRDLGASDTFLGMSVFRGRAAGTLSLSCPGVTVPILLQFGMSHSRPNKLPLPAKASLGRTGEQHLVDTTPYAELVGSILYLSTTTRPDVAYASGLLERYMSNPEEQHWTAAKGVIRYLSGTVNYGLCYGGSEALAGAVDANFGGCPETRRSTTGWVFTWNGAAISWGSKRQPTMSTSPAETEYVAAAAATREALWVRKLMVDLGQPAAPIEMAEDNPACISLIATPETTGRAKTIYIAHHMARERVAMGEVKFTYTPGAEVLADGMTKALPTPAFDTIRSRMGMGATGSGAAG